MVSDSKSDSLSFQFQVYASVVLAFIWGGIVAMAVLSEIRRQDSAEQIKRDRGPVYVYDMKRELLFIADQYHAGNHTFRVQGHEMKVPQQVIISKQRLVTDAEILQPHPDK